MLSMQREDYEISFNYIESSSMCLKNPGKYLLEAINLSVLSHLSPNNINAQEENM